MAISAVLSGSELVTNKEALKKRPNGKKAIVKMAKWKNSAAKNPTTLEGKSCRKITIWKKTVGNAITCQNNQLEFRGM